jgi:hypothetical protein
MSPQDTHRQAGDETQDVEVTPEMVEAGAEALWAEDFPLPNDEEMARVVSKVFTAMTKARRQ